MKIIRSINEVEQDCIIAIYPISDLASIPALRGKFADKDAAMLQTDRGENDEPAIVALVILEREQ